MKCPECDGLGFFPSSNIVAKICPQCNGTGEIEITNEEWLRSATFEEIAGTLYERYTLGYTGGENGVKMRSITEIVEWLKQPRKPIS